MTMARYAALAELAALYAAWDVLDFAAVLAHADRLLALPLAAIANMAGHAARRDMALWFDASTCTYADDGSAVVRRASLICGTPRRCCCAIASTAAYSIRPSW